MSAFDDENPFGAPTVDNPFADPSVQQVTRKPPNINQGLEDYNPFAADQNNQVNDPTNRRVATTPYSSNSGPAVMTPTSQEIPRQPQSYPQNDPPLITTSELQKRQEELDRKAAELERREQELRRSETNVRRNNFPPLPENFCWQPCFYVDINVEIEPDLQRVVRYLLHLWYFHSALLIANILGSVILLFYRGDFSRFIMSIFYAGIFIPISFVCWFRPGYKAFKNDSSINFVVFFAIFFVQFLITLYQVFSSGSCGLTTAVGVFENTPSSVLIGIVILAVAMGFCAAAFFDIILFLKIHKIYRSSDLSLAKAQAEFTSEIMRNERVQQAAGNVVQSAVRNQFSQQQQQPPANRY